MSRNVAQSTTVDQRGDYSKEQQRWGGSTVDVKDCGLVQRVTDLRSNMGWGHTECQGIWFSPLFTRGVTGRNSSRGGVGAHCMSRNMAQSTVDQWGDWLKQQQGWDGAKMGVQEYGSVHC